MNEQIHPSLLKRKIIHFDMDAFYAAIEIRDDPSLRNKPVVIGGSPNSRSVVCTASYEARKYGIKSAISCAKAAKLCPKAVFIAPNFAKYSHVSKNIHKIFQKYTDLIEPLSLDEAYLDVSTNSLFAVKIAKLIQDEICETLNLTGSAGVAPNKLIAKIASDFHKPKGITVVIPEQALYFMKQLPLRKIHGIGPVTERRLAQIGFKNCCDIWPYSLQDLEGKVGKSAGWLYNSARGIDERPVKVTWLRKSLGCEETFSQDLLDEATLQAELAIISAKVATKLQQKMLQGKTVTLKVRYIDFARITRSRTLPNPTSENNLILATALELLSTTQIGTKKIRLLGITISNFN